MSVQKFSNNADSFLSSSIILGATAFSVVAGDGSLFPSLSSEEHFYVRIGSDVSNEVVKVTGRSTDSFTCEATGSAWPEGSQVSLTVSAEMLDEFLQSESESLLDYAKLSGDGQILSDSEFKGYCESLINDPSSIGGSISIDLSLGNVVYVELESNIEEINVLNVPDSGKAASFTAIISNGVGGNLITWPAKFLWAGGTVPEISSDDNSVSIFTFISIDGGVSWFSMLAGDNFS